jgi:hypothetical protein
MFSMLLTRLFHESETLVLQELALVRAETAESVAEFVSGALVLLVGIAVAFVGVLAMAATCIALLAYILPIWIASAVVGILVLAGGAAIAVHGRRLLAKATLIPHRAVQSWHDTARWTREELA